ncbi:muskelin isoform X2 [Bradysia coprophila]|uniref:muskelin isoform X2 n=1 Tax=Bradysia coprophila TaxID=38358 RepID=UPI00187DBB8B|nr:muskelin isoform X2 [Bradysia coprophila]
MTCELNDIKKLTYEIHKYSSYANSYLPENILEDMPSNQGSRWSSSTNNPPQFLTLLLTRPAIVHKIKFGKYEKSHICNIKKFKVFGGLKEDNLQLLLEAGLRDDTKPETFNLRHTTDSGEEIPVLYIKIMPLLSFGVAFNFSIWYVELLGNDDPLFVQKSLGDLNNYRETEIVRLCLKHFRQQGYHSAFKVLREQTNVTLESQLMSDLHETLVVNGNFAKTEEYVEQFIANGLIDNYCMKQKYNAYWSAQETLSKPDERPDVRGGHQLIVDTNENRIYLFGGWDGYFDLSDLWYYDIKLNSWTLIHERADLLGGPSPRSCHKMIFDPVNSQIFTLGRYLSVEARTNQVVNSDFYLYSVKSNSWLLISDDTSQVGGPGLLHDHQMCIDVTENTIYVFGGRILSTKKIDDSSNDNPYSGLYSYHINTNTWTHILVDCNDPLASNPDIRSIKSRSTHSMLLHHRYRKLYVYGGQRGKEYTSDFISIDLDSRSVTVMSSSGYGTKDGENMPQCGFTQRATIDCDKDEIYVFTSLSKEKERKDVNYNVLWMFSLKTNQWSCIYRCNHLKFQCLTKFDKYVCTEPCPRYAHQVVYDMNSKTHYLFGGNPGMEQNPQDRLEDFWLLRLERPSKQQVLQQYKFLIRKLEYEEIARIDPIYAIGYLQTRLSEVTDHKDAAQLKQFHKLATLLFRSEPQSPSKYISLTSTPMCSSPDISNSSTSSSSSSSSLPYSYNHCSSTICCYGKTSPPCSDSDESRSINFDGPCDQKVQRCILFNRIVKLLPDHMVQPKGNLSDFVRI